MGGLRRKQTEPVAKTRRMPVIDPFKPCERETLASVCGDFEEVLHHMAVQPTSAAEAAPDEPFEPGIAAAPARRVRLLVVV